MDPLDDLLGAIRANRAVLRRSFADPPWAFDNDEPAPLMLYTVLRGEVWVIPEDERLATRLRSGDTAVLRGPEPHRIADSPDTLPQAIIRHAMHCVHPGDGHPIDEADAPRIGPRSYGRSTRSPSAVLTGAYRTIDDVGRRLLDALPPLLVVSAESGGPDSAAELIGAELDRDLPGQRLVLDRLLDLLLTRTLSSWFSAPDVQPPAWFRALGDPVVGAGLRAMHAAPEYPWTVADLAATAGVSRAVFARSFTGAVGESPLAYLTRWRMELAERLLREPGTTIAAAARQVGYTNSFAFSTAFKRTRGASPSQLPQRRRV